MTIRLRPHHLLCTRAFKGKGYSPAFVENMHRVIEEIKNGADVTLIPELDAICAACPERNGGLCRSEQKVQTFDARALEQFQLELKTYSYANLQCNITEHLDEAVYEYICRDCAWRQMGVCTYSDVRRALL